MCRVKSIENVEYKQLLVPVKYRDCRPDLIRSSECVKFINKLFAMSIETFVELCCF